MISEDPPRFYEDPKMTKRSLYHWGPGERQEMTRRPQRGGIKESHSHQEKVALDTEKGGGWALPMTPHPHAGLVTTVLDSIPANNHLPSGAPSSPPPARTEMMTKMSPRASLYGQLKFATQICKTDTITSSKHFFFPVFTHVSGMFLSLYMHLQLLTLKARGVKYPTYRQETGGPEKEKECAQGHRGGGRTRTQTWQMEANPDCLDASCRTSQGSLQNRLPRAIFQGGDFP